MNWDSNNLELSKIDHTSTKKLDHDPTIYILKSEKQFYIKRENKYDNVSPKIY